MAATMAVVGLVGGGLKAFGQFQQGQTAEDVAESNAQILDDQADIIKQGAKLDEFRKRKQLKQFVGTQTASHAKSGVEFTGSPLDVIQDTVANAELEISIGKFNSEVASRRKKSEAGRTRFAGEAAGKAGTIGALSTVLSSAGDFAGKFTGGGSSKIGSGGRTPKLSVRGGLIGS